MRPKRITPSRARAQAAPPLHVQNWRMPGSAAQRRGGRAGRAHLQARSRSTGAAGMGEKKGERSQREWEEGKEEEEEGLFKQKAMNEVDTGLGGECDSSESRRRTMKSRELPIVGFIRLGGARKRSPAWLSFPLFIFIFWFPWGGSRK
jgi:hypothetical protein